MALALGALLALIGPAHAQDARKSADPAQLELKVTGVKGAQAIAVRDSLDLALFVERNDLTAGRLRRMVALAPGQARRAMEVYGYYDANVKATPVERAGGWMVTVKVNRGKQTTIVAVDARVDGPGKDERAVAFALEGVRRLADDPFEHVRYEDAKRRVERALLRLGYFDFELDTHQVDVRRSDATARATLVWNSGVRYRFGPLRFEGAQFSDAFLARFVSFTEGEPFDQDKLDELQQHLAAADYFGQISVQAEPEAASDLAVPIAVVLAPAMRNVYRAGASVDSDYGYGVRLGIERRWVNDRGHRLEGDLRLDQRLEAVALEYLIPSASGPENVWGLGLRYRDENTDVVDSRSYIALVSRSHRWRDWHVVGSMNYLDSDYVIGETRSADPDGVRTNSVVAYPELRADRVFARDRIRPRRGGSLSLRARVASADAGSDVTLLQLYASGKWIRPLGKPNRLLLRGELGATVTDDFLAVPPELRFFAGGVSSIRGFEFQTVGDRDSDGEAVGGKNLFTASIEFERQFHPAFAWAAFVDTGDAWTTGTPDPAVGIGAGLRWISPVGPVRIDLAYGIDNDDDGIMLHVSAGPDL